MKKTAIVLTSLLFSTSAIAQTGGLSIKINGIEDGKPIPAKFAYCQPDGKGKTKDGGNISPEIAWSGAPAGTKSFALIVVDKDVPASFEDANKDGKTIANDFPRQDFYHWVLVDIPANLSKLEEGIDSKGMVAGGKPVGKTPYGINGQNDYAAKAKYGPNFGGYDGPCPPWNDERLHHYHFRLYALDTASLGLNGNFSGKDAEEALAKHTLAATEIVGTYRDK